MSRPIPHTSAPVWPKRSSSRFASTIHTDGPEGCRVALLGMPDDTGVRLNGGRPGAAEGPRAFRDALAKYATSTPDDRVWPPVYDAGDVEPAGDDIHETHRRVTEAAGAILDAGLFPIGIGGGHDLTFAFVRALVERSESLSGIYFDAHLDVREETGSGMPMRALIEQSHVRELNIFGFSPFVNSNEHFTYFSRNRGHIRRDEELPDCLETGRSDYFVSFDLDVIDAAHAPGVSAMNPAGWSARQAETALYTVGSSDRLRCFDIMELSPPNDPSGRTARLAAHLFLAFLWGFAERLP